MLLQAVAGCDSSLLTELFAPATWLVQPTEGMQRVSGTREQWQRFAAIVNAKHAKVRQ